MTLTTDPDDPRLRRGSDTEPGPQNEVYLVLSEKERAKGFVRPFVQRYVHHVDLPNGCGAVTFMGTALSETYARDPHFYGATYCVGCQMHKRVGAFGEFYWCNIEGIPLEREGELWKVGT